jgi:uncharacterized caspase-like protein
MSTPSKEEIDQRVAMAHETLRYGGYWPDLEALVALADERDRLQRERDELEGALRLEQEAHQVSIDEFNRVSHERDECVALLEDARTAATHAASSMRITPGVTGWLTRINALLKKLRGEP